MTIKKNHPAALSLISAFRGFPFLFGAAGISQELATPRGTGLRRIRHLVWNLKAFCSPRSTEQKSTMSNRACAHHCRKQTIQECGKYFERRSTEDWACLCRLCTTQGIKWQHSRPRSHMWQNSPLHSQPQLWLFWVALLFISVI